MDETKQLKRTAISFGDEGLTKSKNETKPAAYEGDEATTKTTTFTKQDDSMSIKLISKRYCQIIVKATLKTLYRKHYSHLIKFAIRKRS